MKLSESGRQKLGNVEALSAGAADEAIKIMTNYKLRKKESFDSSGLPLSGGPSFLLYAISHPSRGQLARGGNSVKVT